MDHETGKTERYKAKMRAIEFTILGGIALISAGAVGVIHELKPDESWPKLIFSLLVVPVIVGHFGLLRMLRPWIRRKLSGDETEETE